MESSDLARLLSAVPGDRRAFFKQAAALGLAAPALGGLVMDARAQSTPEAEAADSHSMPADGYVGSDPESASTGEESPVPSAGML